MMKNQYKLTLVLFVLSSVLKAQNVEKIVSINKTHKVSPDTKLKVISSFGDIQIVNWDKAEIKIDIEIIAKANSGDRAQRLLDRIEVTSKETGSLVLYETLIGNMNSRGNESFEVNYDIKIPQNVVLEVDHRFGDLALETRIAKTIISMAYGNIKGIDFAELSLDLSFGSGSINDFEEGNFEIAYSDFSSEEGGQLELEQKFSDIRLYKIRDLDLKSNYGDVKIDILGQAEVNAQFTEFTIDVLKSSLRMTASYVSTFEIGLLEKNFKFVDIASKFGELIINMEKGLKANFDGEFSFAQLKDGIGMDYRLKSKDFNDSEYRATINGGDASKNIKVKSSYGDLRIR